MHRYMCPCGKAIERDVICGRYEKIDEYDMEAFGTLL